FYQTPSSPHTLLVADFNRDGAKDIVVATNVGPLAMLMGKGDGTFKAASVIYTSPTGNFPISAAAFDFNADGNLDLVVAEGSGGIAVLLGNGDGTFRSTRYSLGVSPDLLPFSVAV